MLSGVRPIIIKEFRQIFRDIRSLWLLLFLPAFMLVLFGYAVTFDVNHIRLGLVDQDRSAASRDLARFITSSDYFDLVKRFGTTRGSDAALDHGSVDAVLVIPAGFGEDTGAGKETAVQFLVDGENAQSAATVAGYIQGVMQRYTYRTISAAAKARGLDGLTLPIDLEPRVMYNPELKSARFLIPGLVGFILMVTSVISTAMSIVREREHGTMEQILVSPIKPLELILGKTVPYMIISFVGAMGILAAGYLVFGVTVKGSMLLLTGVTLIFLVGCLAFGLVISTIAQTQQVAFMLAMLSTMLPTFVLSGFIFPIHNMPVIIQAITYVVPARYFLVALRAIILKGAGLSAFWDQVVYLSIYTVLMLGAASVRMKKKGL